jgi:hypothetical protein
MQLGPCKTAHQQYNASDSGWKKEIRAELYTHAAAANPFAVCPEFHFVSIHVDYSFLPGMQQRGVISAGASTNYTGRGVVCPR